MLNSPLPGQEPARASEAQLAQEGQGFMDFMAQHAANTGKV